MGRDEEDRDTYQPKPHLVPVRPSSILSPAPCASPKTFPQLMFPYNGSSPLVHTSTNSHHPMDALRRLQHPPPLPASSSTASSPIAPFPGCSAPQRSPRTPTPQNLSQGQRSMPKTPDTPGSPQLGPLSSPPPPSSPVTLGGVGGGRGPQTHHPHSVIVQGSPLSPTPSPSPSVVGNMNCASPHRRSRHPSTSSSSLSEQGGGAGAGGMMGNHFPQRRKSTSSSPHSSSPLPGGSPNPGLHFPKYKLEDILEQFKNAGNSTINNNHLLFPANPSSLLTNQSSNPHILSLALDKGGNLKPSKVPAGPGPNAGPPGFGLNAAGPSGVPLGPFLNHHHSHQGRQPHPSSFPASSLLSAAAKAQLACQTTQNQGPNLGSNPLSSASPLEVLKETQQQQSLKVTNSTLHSNHPPSSVATIRPPLPHPSLAVASSLLFPPSHPLAQSLAASSHHLPPVVECNAPHRKRQRRSPTVLSMLRETQQLTNGPRKTPPVDLASSAIINLSSSSSSSLHSSSTSFSQSHNTAILENHHHLLLPGQTPRLSARQPMPLVGPHRQMEALDFTTGLGAAASGPPLGLDPPSQPLSALLHLLSVQNAQTSASASNSASPQLGSVSIGGGGGGGVNRQSPRPPPSSPGSLSSIIRPLQTLSPCRTNNTTPRTSTPQPLSPPPCSSHSRSTQSPSHPPPAKTSPKQRRSPSSAVLSNSHLPPHKSYSVPPHPTTLSLFEKPPRNHHIPTMDSVSQAPLREASPQVPTTTDMDSSSMSVTTVDLSHSQGGVGMTTSTSPKPLDLSNHVLALLAASSTVPQGEGGLSDCTTGTASTTQLGNNSSKGEEETFVYLGRVTLKNRTEWIFI